jgi:imidazole glycerol-phosphate synthase subunit HisH
MADRSIIIIDYGMGNIRSIFNKVNRAGYSVNVTSDITEIRTADKIILPGVGHFLTGMNRLRERDLIGILNKKVIDDKTPILGICLGMQLFTSHSEEGDTNGLGWIDGKTVRFNIKDSKLKVPHMGWNTVEQKKDSQLLKGVPGSGAFYFVHSFYVRCNSQADILTTTIYGQEFVSSVQKDNIYGTQFHPEKSHGTGEMVLKNFLNI